jgi:hypothetical protein
MDSVLTFPLLTISSSLMNFRTYFPTGKLCLIKITL